jgi:hypothetical protein
MLPEIAQPFFMIEQSTLSHISITEVRHDGKSRERNVYFGIREDMKATTHARDYAAREALAFARWIPELSERHFSTAAYPSRKTKNQVSGLLWCSRTQEARHSSYLLL